MFSEPKSSQNQQKHIVFVWIGVKWHLLFRFRLELLFLFKNKTHSYTHRNTCAHTHSRTYAITHNQYVCVFICRASIIRFRHLMVHRAFENSITLHTHIQAENCAYEKKILCLCTFVCTQQITIVRHRCYALNNNIGRRHRRIELYNTNEPERNTYIFILATYIYKKRLCEWERERESKCHSFFFSWLLLLAKTPSHHGRRKISKWNIKDIS